MAMGEAMAKAKAMARARAKGKSKAVGRSFVLPVRGWIWGLCSRLEVLGRKTLHEILRAPPSAAGPRLEPNNLTGDQTYSITRITKIP